MTEIWVCGDCRSVNGAKQSRCYRCQVPKSTGQMTEATAAISTSNARQTGTVLARATRMGATYLPTWPLAVLLIPLMVAATVSLFNMTNAMLGAIDRNGSFIRDRVVVQHTLDAATTGGAIFIAALVVWSIWIALVVRNVPALTARWAPNGSISALLAAWIPFINLKRPHSVVRGVLSTLAGGRPMPVLVALAWWVAVLAAYIVPTLYIWFGRSDDVYGSLATILTVQNVMVVIALVFAVAVVVLVEWEQRLALTRRADAVLGEPAAAT